MESSKKRILFFSCEPGGAEVLIPVIKLVQAQPDFEAVVLGYGHALARFARKKITCREIGPISLEDYSLLDYYTPDFLITSATSLPYVDMTEKYLWWQAKQRDIQSLAFLDQWQNYAVRFSGNKDHERLAYLPDWINCLNGIGREEMIREGFDEGRLVEFGHPYLSSLNHELSRLNIPRLKADLHISSINNVALFVSEPIREYYGEKRGYDQYQVLEYFLANIAKLMEQPKILVKLHPKENHQSFRELAKKFEILSPQFISNDLSSLECLAVSDFIFGMSSIMLIEAYVLGKKVVSLQPGLRIEDPFVLSRHKLIPIVISDKQYNYIELKCPPHTWFNVEFACEEFLEFLKQTTAVLRGNC